MLPILLEAGLNIIISKEVAEENRVGVEKGYRDAFIRKELLGSGKIRIMNAGSKGIIKKDYGMKDADASAISLAKERNAHLASEDRVMQNIAKSIGIKITNTAMLIYHAYKKKGISKNQCMILL